MVRTDIAPINEGFFTALRREFRKRKYDAATVEEYLHSLKSFVAYFYPCHPRQLTDTDIRGFLLHIQRYRPFTPEGGASFLNALRFLYAEVYGMPFRITSMPEPRGRGTRPTAPDRAELATIISSIGNAKHRALLALICSAGLRLGEAVKLRARDIDTNKHVVRVRSTDGRQDRLAPLPSVALEELQFYFKEFKPTTWLFEGQQGGTHLSRSSAEKILRRAI